MTIKTAFLLLSPGPSMSLTTITFVDITSDGAPIPDAIARIPIKYYKTLASDGKKAFSNWLEVTTSTRKLVCKGVPAKHDEISFLEATSNLWTMEESSKASIPDGTCMIGSFLPKMPLLTSLTIKQLSGPTADLTVIKAGLVHRPICRGMHFSSRHLKDCEFQVIGFEALDCGAASIETYALVAPQTVINVSVTKSQEPQEPKTLSTEAPVGLEGPFSQIKDLLDPRVLKAMRARGIQMPRGVLMSGPPGVGKTFLARHIANVSGIPLVVVNGPELLSPISGESERNLLEVFRRAELLAQDTDLKCSLVFFDEIDAIARKREDSLSESISETRLMTHLLTILDGFNESKEHLIILAATNRPNALDPALRRPGRFDREIIFEAPNEETRELILRNLTRNINFSSSEDQNDVLKEIAKSCAGYVASDLASLVNELTFLESPMVTREHFIAAMRRVGPSLHRQYKISLDNRVRWSDIGGIDRIRDDLRKYVEWPLVHGEAYQRLGLKPPKGVLLYGPPGCSKTTIAKAIANESGFTFYSLNGASLYSCYLGESEQLIRDMFQCARMTAPSVVFFDEMDAVVGKRSDKYGISTTDPVQERIISTLLNEMDGIVEGSDKNVLVIGATNRKDLIDEALLRPGRFDRHILVPLPDESGRREILNLYLKGRECDESIDVKSLSEVTEGFSGADLKGLVQEAAILAMHDGSFAFNQQHFLQVLRNPNRSRTKSNI